MFLEILVPLYSAVHGNWPLKELAELADWPAACGMVARGGCSFAWNFTVTRPTAFVEAERRTRPTMTLH